MAAQPPQQFVELLDIARGYQWSRALTAVAELGIADLLEGGRRSVADLASATGTHEEALYRVMRALASIGVFEEDEARGFALSKVGQFLR